MNFLSKESIDVLINLVEIELSKVDGFTVTSALRRCELAATLRRLQEMRSPFPFAVAA